jgi:hypothetical protein
VAGASNNGNGASSSGSNGSGSTALLKLGTGPGESAVVPSAAAEPGSSFDENVVVAEAPGGEWSRFKQYSVFAVRARRVLGTHWRLRCAHSARRSAQYLEALRARFVAAHARDSHATVRAPGGAAHV